MFLTTIETLAKDPDSVLATKVTSDVTLYFDRDPTHFRYILNYLRTGIFYEPDNDLAKKELLLEAKFYNVLHIAYQIDPPFSEGSTILPYGSDFQTVLQSWLQEDGISSDNWELIYRGTRDGFGASSFHALCDNKGPTITVIKSVGDCIFGGYSDVSWTSSNSFIQSTDAFLFAFVSNGLGTTPF